MRAARARGSAIGRPPTPIAVRDLARVRSGVVTVAELAREIGCSPVTIRRRLRSVGWITDRDLARVRSGELSLTDLTDQIARRLRKKRGTL